MRKDPTTEQQPHTGRLTTRQPLILTIAIQKGGVGKTTIAVHFAMRAAELKYRVLLIDCDSQANASSVFIEAGAERGSSSLYGANKTAKPASSHVSPRIDVISAEDGLISIPGDNPTARTKAINHFIANVQRLAAGYDFVIIDTPPARGVVTDGALAAATHVLSPMTPTQYGLDGVEKLLTTIETIKSTYNAGLKNLGILINRWSTRSADESAAVTDMRNAIPHLLVPFSISARAAYATAESNRSAVWRVEGGAARQASKEMRNALDWIIHTMETAV